MSKYRNKKNVNRLRAATNTDKQQVRVGGDVSQWRRHLENVAPQGEGQQETRSFTELLDALIDAARNVQRTSNHDGTGIALAESCRSELEVARAAVMEAYQKMERIAENTRHPKKKGLTE